jgi:hypothetical protein
MQPLTIEQLIQQVQLVLKHLRCPGQCHSLLRIMLAWAQLGTGMGFPLLESPFKLAPYLECKWLTSIRTGLASIGARIKTTESFIQLPRRALDCHIMYGFGDCERFTTGQMCKLNACRLYLKVTLLSDVSTPCGRYINTAYYKGTRSKGIDWPTIQYPCQEKSEAKSWALWRKAFQLVYLRDDKYHLRIKLGDWHPGKSYHHRWQWNHTVT